MRSFLRQARGVLTFAGLTINTFIWFAPVFLLAIVKLVMPVEKARSVVSRWLMAMAENWISGNALLLSGSGSRGWQPQGAEELAPDGW